VIDVQGRSLAGLSVRHATNDLGRSFDERAPDAPGGARARTALVISVSRRFHFQVELALPDEADELAVLDEKGQELEISEFLGNGRIEDQRQAIRDGRTNTLGVGDEGRTVVLYRAGVEVRRAPLRLVPGERVVVEL
jgi:hypothetical protein